MKIGYYRSGDEGNAYIIPEDKVEDFDKDLEFLDGMSYDECIEINGNAKAFNLFDQNYSKYIVASEIFNYRIIMEE